MENTWGGIKAGKNDQPEQLSNAHEGFGHDDDESEKFDDKKHCKRLSGVSINSNERQSQNKNRALNFTGSKTEFTEGWNQLWRSFNRENGAA